MKNEVAKPQVAHGLGKLEGVEGVCLGERGLSSHHLPGKH